MSGISEVEWRVACWDLCEGVISYYVKMWPSLVGFSRGASELRGNVLKSDLKYRLSIPVISYREWQSLGCPSWSLYVLSGLLGRFINCERDLDDAMLEYSFGRFGSEPREDSEDEEENTILRAYPRRKGSFAVKNV